MRWSNYKDVVVEWSSSAVEISKQVISNSLSEISAAVNTIPQFEAEIITPIIVFNPLGENRTDLATVSLSLTRGAAESLKVLDVDGEPVPSQIIASTRYDDGSLKEATLIFLADVPSLGYKMYYVAFSKMPAATSPFQLQISDENLKVENEFYSVTFDKAHGGCITSLYDKDLGKEFIDGSQGLGNNYIGWIPSLGDFSQSSSQPAKITVVENGPVRVHIRIEGIFHEYPYVANIYLYSGVKRIDFEVSFDFGTNACIGESGDKYTRLYTSAEYTYHRPWHRNDKKLQVIFPLSIENGDVYADAPFDVFKVPNMGTYTFPPSYCSSLTWVDVSNGTLGFSLVLDRSTAIEYQNNCLSAVLAYGGLYEYAPAKKAFLDGKHTYRYSIYTHAGAWAEGRVPNIARTYTYPLIAAVTTVHEGEKPPVQSIISVTTRGRSTQMPIITAVQCRNGEAYVRIYQPYAETEQIILSASSIESFNASDVYVVNLLGRNLYKPLIDHGRILLTMNPQEIKTLKIASRVPRITRPNAVTASVSDITGTSLKLTWTESPDPDFVRYEVFQSRCKVSRATFEDVLGVSIANITDKTTTSLTISGLNPGTTYYFTIRVWDADGLYRDSAQLSVTTLAPTLFWQEPWFMASIVVAIISVAVVAFVLKKGSLVRSDRSSRDPFEIVHRPGNTLMKYPLRKMSCGLSQ